MRTLPGQHLIYKEHDQRIQLRNLPGLQGGKQICAKWIIQAVQCGDKIGKKKRPGWSSNGARESQDIFDWRCSLSDWSLVSYSVTSVVLLYPAGPETMVNLRPARKLVSSCSSRRGRATKPTRWGGMWNFVARIDLWIGAIITRRNNYRESTECFRIIHRL